MKVFFKVLVVALLVFIPGLAGYAQTQIKQRNIAQAPAARAEDTITISLPQSALVRTARDSMSGRVSGFDSQGRKLTLSAENGFSQSLAIAQIKSVTFTGDVWIPSAGGARRIRGQERVATTTGQQIWRSVPLNAFELRDANQGQAIVRLRTVVSGDELEDIRNVAATTPYVVDEISFESSGKMTIKATPYSP
ncbi:MAG TPA: hypothetical protein DCY88_34290 [Cyanobacteria bacterium UBA11372]|nr:hypothetical protein [Cyanobacteria bacterium UBA11372]